MSEKELLELAKKFGDNYTYGKIVEILKDKFMDKQGVKKTIEEHKDCRHKYCNLEREESPCWKVILKDLELK